MKPHMPKGLIRAIGALLTALALYSLLGFLILPGIALRVANQQLANYATVPAHLQRIELNPFSLEVTLWGLVIGDPGKEQVGFDRLYANLQIDSLWAKALHLSDIELDKPKSEILFAKDGKLNLLGLFNVPPSEPTPADPDAKPFPLRIDNIKLAGGVVHFEDMRPSEPIEFLYDDLSFELKNLSTLPEDSADMTLVAIGPAGGRIDWTGNFSLIPFTSEGTLKVTDGQMKSFWPYVRDAVPLVLENGVVSLSTEYKLNLSKQTELLLNNVAVSIAPFAIKAPDGRPLARLERLDVSDTSLDLAKQQVMVGKIRSNKLETWAALEADGQLDWQKLFASQPSKPAAKAAAEPTDTPAAADSPKPEPSAPSKPWQVLVKDVQLRNYTVHLADRSAQPAVALDITPLNVDLQDFDSLNGSPFKLKLDSGLGKQGKISADGTVNLAPVNAQLNVKTEDVDLRVAQSYINPFIRLELRSGMLGSDLKVNLKSTEPLALSVTGRAQIDQLHTLDTLKTRDFLKWQQVVVDGINYQHGDSLSINKVNLLQPYVRFMINDDRTTNVDDLLIPQPADSGAKPAGAKPPSKDKPLGISSTARSAPSTAVRQNRPASTSKARSTAMRR
jgi:uncharacterized protein involved in outer membrane biogenesis